jgi:predicted O-methyltransferase YrrM
VAALTVEEKILQAYKFSESQPAIPHLRTLPHAHERYYWFLHYLAGVLQPRAILELGVYRGTSLAHLASGCMEATVIGVDKDFSNLDLGVIKPYPNIQIIERDSLHYLKSEYRHVFGLVFIDTLHELSQVEKELGALWPHMVRNGVICIDDIFYSDDMMNWWNRLNLEKMSLAHLHTTGFGVIINRWT